MKNAIGCLLVVLFFISCSTTKKIKTGAAGIKNGDHVTSVSENKTIDELKKLLYTENELPFRTFSAKVKVSYEDAGGKQPDVNAFVRMKKDEAIWISVAATFLNIEAMRVLITPDSVFILNKMEKTYGVYPISYINERLSIPVNFQDAQRLIAGKIVLTGDSILSVNQSGNFIQAIITMPGIYNSIYFTDPGMLLARQVVNVSQPGDHFTANILYDNYEKTSIGLFSTSRNISIPEKSQKLQLVFRQYEFNNELSLPFSRPEGYEIK